MNCKPGDLAIVVRSQLGNEGKIVRCIRLASGWNAVWEIDRAIAKHTFQDKEFVRLAPDECLRPIRDAGDDARDEMLRPLPEEVPA